MVRVINTVGNQLIYEVATNKINSFHRVHIKQGGDERDFDQIDQDKQANTIGMVAEVYHDYSSEEEAAEDDSNGDEEEKNE